jgi:hypothetical protein
MNEPLDDEIASLYSRLNKADWSAVFDALFANWCPYPDEAYARKVGWPVNTDGTITTPGIGRVPSRELIEVDKLERVFKLEDRRDRKRSVHVGFTGTKIGMQPNQRLELAEYLSYLKNLGFTHFHHGVALGPTLRRRSLPRLLASFLFVTPVTPKTKRTRCIGRSLTSTM